MNRPLPSGPPAPRLSGDTRRSLWRMLRHVSLAAAVVHVVFLLLFAGLGLSVLAWCNLASVLLFLTCRWLLARRRNLAAVMLIVAEVMLHASAAVRLLGWDSGFHYYLLTLVVPLAVAMNGSTASKFARLALFCAYYGSLDAWMRGTLPIYTLGGHALDVLRYFNLAGTIAIMSFISLTYYGMVASAEGALRTLATTDPLTGLHNRRQWLDIARREQAAGPAGRAVGVLLCDIDHFKRINDGHGHETGDRALQQISRVLAASLRERDAVARWGGEEFLVLLPDAPADAAVQVGERIRRAIGEVRLEMAGQPALQMTVTIGVARLLDGEPIEAAIARADAALYRGKLAGRDRVVVAEAVEPAGGADASLAASPPAAWPAGSRVVA